MWMIWGPRSVLTPRRGRPGIATVYELHDGAKPATPAWDGLYDTDDWLII